MGTVAEYTKEELLNGFASNNGEFIRDLYEVYYSSIKTLILANKGSEQDAEDIFQEVTVILYRKLVISDFDMTSSLKTFMYKIARNIWFNELDHRSRRPTTIIEGDIFESRDSNIEELIYQNERLKLFREKFEELSENCKKVLSLFLNNIPIKEITAALGFKSDQHTKNRRFRCKKALIKLIRESDIYKELLGYGNTKDDRSIPRW